MFEDRSTSMKNESANTVETSSSSSRKYIVMDDKLYEAARVKGKDIPSSMMADEIFKSRTRGVEINNVFHVSALHGNEGFIKKELENNEHHFYSLLSEQNSRGETPLHLAAQFGHKKTVEVLLDAHDYGESSVSLDTVYEHKYYLSAKDKNGDTPLHAAIKYAHQDIAILLVQRDANLLSIDNQAQESPAYLAAKNLCESFFRKVLEIEGYDQSSLSFSGPFGMTVFHPARILNDDIMLTLIDRRKELLKHQDNKGKTVLHYAVEDNIEPMVEILLKADSSLAYLHDNDGMTPLHTATSMGSFPLVRAILELSPQSISMVCKTGDYKGKTALHVAMMDACFLRVCLTHRRMRELINVTDTEGNTPLHLAAKNSRDLDIADASLVAGGIDWWLKNRDGFTPMDLRKPNRKILSSKLEKIISEYWRVHDEVNVQILRDCNISLDWLMRSPETDWEDVFTTWRGVEGESIVHLAARQGHMKIINKATEWDCKSRVLVLSGENSRGETPLHVAAAVGDLGVVDCILDLSISTDKLGNKKQQQLDVVVVEPIHPPNHDQDHHNNGNSGGVNHIMNQHSEWKPWKSKSRNGDTPVHVALRNGHEQITLRLLEWDPQLIFSSVNKANESLLYLAVHGGYDEVISKMLSDDSQPISTNGPRGQNALHAAVRCPQVPSEKKLPNVPSFSFDKTNILEPNHSLMERGATYYLLTRLPQLLNKVDSDGKTPLHCTVELGRKGNLYHMLCRDEGTSATLMYDTEGFTPLLRAFANGYHKCAYYMIVQCPYAAQLRHAHSEKTILHLLKVTSGNALKQWMKYMRRKPQITKLINETDKEGEHTTTLCHFRIRRKQNTSSIVNKWCKVVYSKQATSNTYGPLYTSYEKRGL